MRWVRHVAGAISSAASAAANSASNAAASSPARSRWNAKLAGGVGGRQREAWLGLQRRRDGPVEPSPLSRQRGAVGDLTDERVPNPIGVSRGVDDEQSGIERGTHRGLGGRLVELDHGREERWIGVAADRGECGEDMPSRWVEARDVGLQEIGQHRRDRLTSEVRGDELLGEERIAFTAAQELVHQRRWRGDAQARRRPEPRRHSGRDPPTASRSTVLSRLSSAIRRRNGASRATSSVR